MRTVKKESVEEKKTSTYRSYFEGQQYFFNRNNTRLTVYPVKVTSPQGFSEFQAGIQINNVDEENKLIRLDDDKMDFASVTLGKKECIKIAYNLRKVIEALDADKKKIFELHRLGDIYNHTSKETNSGPEFNFVVDDEGIYVSITSYKNSDPENEHKHYFVNTMSDLYYDLDGNVVENRFNVDIIQFAEILNLFGTGVFEMSLGVLSGGSGRTNGVVNRAKLNVGTKNRKVDEVDEDEVDDDNDSSNDEPEEEKPVGKKIIKKVKKTSDGEAKPVKRSTSSLRKFIEEEDD